MLLDINTVDTPACTYGSHSYRYTVYYPKNALNANGTLANSYPGLVFLHGGGWSAGSRNDCSTQCHALARQGVVVMSIDYTLAVPANEPALPSIMQDISEALTQIASFTCVAGQPISLGGCSAGGHLALVFALTQSHQLHSVVTYSAPTDMVAFAAMLEVASNNVLDYLLGTDFTEAELLAASPLALPITSYITPTLLLQGELDCFMPVISNESFYVRLLAASKPGQLVRFQSATHDIVEEVGKAAGAAYEVLR